MALATAMYYSGKNPLKKVTYKSESVTVSKDIEQRRLQKAFLRYHDPKNWPMLRTALRKMGRDDLIGSAPHCLVPADKPVRGGKSASHATAKHGAARRRHTAGGKPGRKTVKRRIH